MEVRGFSTKSLILSLALVLVLVSTPPLGLAQGRPTAPASGMPGGGPSDFALPSFSAAATQFPGATPPVSDASDSAHPSRADVLTRGSLPGLQEGATLQPQAQNVELVGQIGGSVYAVALQGDYAYIGVGPRLVILDVSNPAQPPVIGQTGVLPGMVGDVAVAGAYAYVADGEGGLRIVDVSDPAHPAEAGSYDTPGVAYDVAVSGAYAYVADREGGLRIVDVSDPAHPAETGSCDTPGSFAWGVAVSGAYAYVADRGSGLRIVDVSDPAHPAEVGFYDTPGQAHGVAVSGAYAYVADWGGLRIVDVSDPAHPSEVGFYNTLYAVGVAVSGAYAYVAAEFSGLRIVDVSDPAHPAEAGSCATLYAVGVAVSGAYAYVADGEGGLRIVDVSDPAHPTEAGSCDTPGAAWGVAVSGAYAYVADREGGLRIVDVSDPAHPAEVGFYNTPGYAYGVAVAGAYAYVADREGGLIILRFTGSGTGTSPSGLLTLLLASSLPATHSLTARVLARNTGAAPQQFTLIIRLWQGSTTLGTQTFALSPAGGATADQPVDFGLRPAGRYRVEATLSAGGITLATRSRDVVVADPDVSRIMLYAGDLKATAHAELDDIAYIPAYALADEIMTLGLDALEDKAIGKFADLAAPIQDAGGISPATSDAAITQMQDKLGRIRQHKQSRSIAIRLFVHDGYGVTLPNGFDPLNPDLDFITDPILKDRIKGAIVGYLANFLRDRLISPLWVNTPRGEVDARHTAFEDFVGSHAVAEPPGLARQMQAGQDRIHNVVESDALVTLGPYDVLGHTLRYDLTLQEQENKRQQMDKFGDVLKIALAAVLVIGVVIILLLIIGAISSAGTLAAVVAPIIWKIIKILSTLSKVSKVAIALLVVSMLFTVPVIAPHVPQYHDETLDAAEALINGKGLASLHSFDVTVQPNEARLTARVAGPETGESQVLVETALYSVDGRITHIVWSPLQIQAGQQATLSKDVPLAPGAYRAVTTLYAEGNVTAVETVPFNMAEPAVELALSLTPSRLSLGEPVQAHVTLTNTSAISDVNDLTLIVESTDGVNFDAWPVSLAAGTAQQIDYTFTPPMTGAYVLRASLGIGLNTLEQQDAAYSVGNGPAVALNTNVSDVYTPGLAVTLPLTLTNVGDTAAAVTVTVHTMDRLQTGVVIFSSTLTVAVPSGATMFATATALPNAQPGLYSAWLEMNGIMYDARDFAVSAENTLFGLLTVGDLYPAVGQSVPVTATVRDADNTPTNATITVTLQSPTGMLTILPMTRVSSGTYRANYTPLISGTYSLELAVTRANNRSVGGQAFFVAGTPTLLIPTIEGQPRAEAILPLTVTVHSEAGIPIPDVTVVLSGTEEVLRGKTDAAGRLVLQTFPPDARSYVLTTDKLGYAGAITEVNVEWVRLYLPLVLRNR